MKEFFIENKKSILVLIGTAVLIISITTFIMLKVINQESDEKPNVDGPNVEDPVEEPNTEEPVIEEPNLYPKLYLISDGMLTYSSRDKVTDEYEKVLFEYQCKTEKCDLFSYANDYVVIEDGDVTLQNYITQSKTKLNLNADLCSGYDVRSDDDKVYGIAVTASSSDESVAYYDFTKQKLITGFKYKYISYDIEALKRGFAFGTVDGTTDIIDIETEKVIQSFQGNASIVGSGQYYYFLIAKDDRSSYTVVYNSNFERVIGDKEYGEISVRSNGNILVANIYDKTIQDENSTTDDKYYEYDKTGKLIFESRSYLKVLSVDHDYVAVLDNDNFYKIIDIRDNIKGVLIKDTEKIFSHSYLSGWYKEKMFLVLEEEKPDSYETTCKEYYYDPATKKTGYIEIDSCSGYAKPVLYLYPTKKTKIIVNFEDKNLLTTTYPKFNNNWTVNAYPNGDLYDLSGKYYYGLYWEEKGSTAVDFKTGFYVTKDNSIRFLEEKLTKLGLNDKERNEFIMYWLPILEKNGKSLVYFEQTAERDNYNRLLISPKPDSILRIAIHVKKVDKYTQIVEQKLYPFNRVGFSVVEWGGVIH